jgi:MerR family mercuric resistance operon transcriptional regulator
VSEKAFLIGEAAGKSGVHAETIRFFEREGLLAPVDRSRGGRRLYRTSEIKRLRFIKRCRDLGFSLAEIRPLLAIADRGNDCRSVAPLLEIHRGKVRAKLRDLRRLEKTMTDAIADCASNRRQACPVIERLIS